MSKTAENYQKFWFFNVTVPLAGAFFLWLRFFLLKRWNCKILNVLEMVWHQMMRFIFLKNFFALHLESRFLDRDFDWDFYIQKFILKHMVVTSWQPLQNNTDSWTKSANFKRHFDYFCIEFLQQRCVKESLTSHLRQNTS